MLHLITLLLALVFQQSSYMPNVDADPAAITRGQTTTVIVTGPNLEALKTLKIEPATGLHVGAVTPLSPRSGGVQAVSVVIAVDETAAPGYRDMLVLQPAGRGVTGSATPETVATIHINSHEIKVSNVVVTRADEMFQLRVTASDGQGDIDAEPALDARAHCGPEAIDAVAEDAAIVNRQGPTFILDAHMNAAPFGKRTGCEVRVRLQDRAGNTSAWMPASLR